jgi:hypothetical protein
MKVGNVFFLFEPGPKVVHSAPSISEHDADNLLRLVTMLTMHAI